MYLVWTNLTVGSKFWKWTH